MLSYNIAKNRILSARNTGGITPAILKGAVEGILSQVSDSDKQRLIQDLDLLPILEEKKEEPTQSSPLEEKTPESTENHYTIYSNRVTVDAVVGDNNSIKKAIETLNKLLT